MAEVSVTYSVDDVIGALSGADTYVISAAYSGRYEMVDIVIDAELALQQADLTEKQLEVMYYIWIVGWTQDFTAKVLGVSQSAVSQREFVARKNIQKVLDRWAGEVGV